MKKILFFTFLFLFISSISFSGCTLVGLSWRHLTTSWGTGFAPYTQPPGYVLVYTWNGGAVTGWVDTKRGTGCQTYPDMILDWLGYGYTDYPWGNFGTCSTLSSCPSTTDYTIIVPYNQIDDGLSTHRTKWIVDHCNRPVNYWNFDDSNGINQNMFELAPINITNAVKVSGSCTAADPCTIDVTVWIPAIGGVYGDGSITPVTDTLAGAVVMYKQSATDPTSGDETQWTEITTDPENDQYFNQTEIGSALRASKTITISGITSTDNIYLSYKPILQYEAACVTNNACTVAELQTLDSQGFDIGYVTANSPPIVPTPVTIVSFTAKYADLQNVNLNWETASEVDSAGFFLYRSIDGQNWTQVNSQIIPAKGQGGGGAVYSYSDTVPKQRTYTKYYYKLEEISNNGERTAEAQTETTK